MGVKMTKQDRETARVIAETIVTTSRAAEGNPTKVISTAARLYGVDEETIVLWLAQLAIEGERS